jgi:NAD(P)-dependent dehydrogenase (short-subunit alcohol dehydrogenase family)
MADTGMQLGGRTALIIGGTTGIGRAAALEFAAAGANVFIAGLGADAGHEAVAEIRARYGTGAEFLEADVRHDAQVRSVMERAAAKFGRIHAALNNAGTEQHFVWLGMKYEIPHMLAHGGGAIVNTTSMAGIEGIANVAVYTASKHGVVGLTKASALELARSNIRVNAVAPGPVDTGLLARMIAGKIEVSTIAESVPMGRISSPAEIARGMVWLCSDAASYVTGHTLVIDGGATIG